VPRETYQNARAEDVSLPEYREIDNQNQRSTPRVVRNALARASRLARVLELAERGPDIRVRLASEIALIEHAKAATVKRRCVRLPPGGS
jgi:hypothetical protein